MNLFRRFCLPILLLVVSFTVSIPARAAAEESASMQAAPKPPPYRHYTYPQIVRLAYVEGDVRVERGETKDAGWEAAVTGLPLYSGFSLVTGTTGRAEIEFEDASTLYLDSNSVLVLNDLHTSSGIPFTKVSLVTGTVAMNVHLRVAGELFVLQTPTDLISAKYPQKVDSRITSYTNAMAVAPLEDGVMTLLGGMREMVKAGTTFYYDHGVPVGPSEAHSAHAQAGAKTNAASGAVSGMAGGAQDSDSFAAFDNWVAGRAAARNAAMKEEMAASGLKQPISGLDALAGQGNFFPCAPYGTCWEPPAATPNQAPVRVDAPAQATQQTAQNVAKFELISLADPPALPFGTPLVLPFDDAMDFFPCLPDAMLYRFGMYPYGFGNEPYAYPWEWAVCHHGTWIRHQKRYVWVVSRRRWHRPPIGWVREGHTVGFVPRNPRDGLDKLPVNRVHGIYTLSGQLSDKANPKLDLTALMPGGKVELLKSPPKEYRNLFFAPLSPAEEPHMEARSMDFARRGGPGTIPAKDVSLSFDHKTQSFMMARQVSVGGHMRIVSTPVTNSGGARLSGRLGGGGFSGGGVHAGGGFSGGGGHAGGGGGHMGGGGGHAGGGGGHAGGGAHH